MKASLQRFPQLNRLERDLWTFDHAFLTSKNEIYVSNALEHYDELRQGIASCAQVNVEATENVCRKAIPREWLGLYETAYTGVLIDRSDPEILDKLHLLHPPAIVAVTQRIHIATSLSDGSIETQKYFNYDEFPNHNERHWQVMTHWSPDRKSFAAMTEAYAREGLMIVHLDGKCIRTWENRAILERLKTQLEEPQTQARRSLKIEMGM